MKNTALTQFQLMIPRSNIKNKMRKFCITNCRS